MAKKLTTAEFIERAKKVHGDKYDYSKAEYKNGSTKVIIGCSEHGDFEQTPIHHMKGSGCRRCGFLSTGKSKALTTEDFIKRSTEVHGDKFDYSKVVYANKNTKVVISCPEHGEFSQTPASHMNGSGCYDCGLISRGRKKASTTESFIKRARDVHGDKYDYSKAEYEKNNSNVIIVCPAHGEFEQTPASHMNGRGCPDCALISRAKKNTLSTEDFLEKAEATHGDTYSYAKTEYTNAKDKLVITCKIHGDFEQAPLHHLDGQGCPLCGIAFNAQNRSSNTDEFVVKSRQVHGDRYNYDQVDYINGYSKVTIDCVEHGPFEQSPSMHMKGVGCPACGVIATADSHRSNTEDFIAKAEAVHGDAYLYHKIEYKGAFDKVTIVCPEHGEFEQAATHHLSGSGCASCAESGFQREKPAILYYLRIQNMTRTVYKIGITNRTVEERFRAIDLDIITILKTTRYQSGSDCYAAEQEILKQFTAYKYTGEDMLTSGNTELFTRDVLGLDNYSE